VGRPDLTTEALLMAAALSFGPAAFVSHCSAGLLWGIWRDLSNAIHVSTKSIHRKRDGLVPHQRKGIIPVRCTGIPTTDVVDTITDMALLLDTGPLETLVNNADKRNLIDPEALRAALDRRTRRPGIGKLKAVLDRATFIYTDSDPRGRPNRLLLPGPRRGMRRPPLPPNGLHAEQGPRPQQRAHAAERDHAPLQPRADQVRDGLRRGYVVSNPPSTGSSTPVMYDDASEARNTAAATSSSDSPVRPAGTRNII
jgi:hypothetical protein